jgi:tetratricopeptide (TPR) repeat protein
MGDQAPEVARQAAQLYYKATPSPSWDRESRTLWETLTSHSRALADCEYTDNAMRGNLYAELAQVFRHAGNYREGVEAARRALAARERVLGPEHPDTMISVSSLGFLFESQGNYAEAEPLYRRALSGFTKVLGPNHPTTRAVAANLQRCLDAMRQPPA